MFLLGATVAEAFPVRIVGVAAGATSLATIFIVATAVVYSWQLATLVGLMTMLLVEARRRKPLVRVAYNTALYSLGGAAAGAMVLVVPSHTDIGLVSAGAFYLTDIVLLAAVVSAANSAHFVPVLRGYVVSTLTPFLLMATTTAILVVLWGRAPALGAVARAAVGGDRAVSALELPRGAGDAAGADRSAHRTRQLPPLPGADAGGAGRGRAGSGPADALSDRHRRLQEHQRPLRSSGRRSDSRARRRAAAPGRRGVPPRR